MQNQNAMKHTNIFIYRELSYIKPFKGNEIPNIIKNYYRQVAMPKINMKLYLVETLNNLNIENGLEIANKILYILKYANSTLSLFKNKNIQMVFILNIISSIINSIIENKYDINILLEDLIRKRFEQILTGKELENNRKFLNEVFEIKENPEELNSLKHKEPQVEEIIKKQLSELKINSQNYENKVILFYESINHFNNFVLVGPPLSGKSNLLATINIISKELNNINKNKYPKFLNIKIYPNNINKNKYPKFLNIKIYPKSKSSKEIFSEHIIGKAFRSYNNYFYDMLYLFNTENVEMINKLNNYYNSLVKYKLPELEEDLTPEKLNEIFKKEEKDNVIDENSSASYQREEEIDKMIEKETKIIIFDGSIDDTWIEYINNLYDKDKFLTLSNGENLNFRDDVKLFFETTNLKNTPPSFLLNQIY